MSIPQWGPLDRGASILAAFVLAFILIGAAYAISASLPNSPESMTAASAPTVSGSSSIPDCATIKSTPTIVSTETETQKQQCICTDNTAKPPVYREVDYQVTAQIQTGQPTALTKRSVGIVVSAAASPKCNVTYCKAGSKTCNPATSVNQDQLSSQLNQNSQQATQNFPQETVANCLAQTTGAQTCISSLGPVDSSTQKALQDAFTGLTSNTTLNCTNQVAQPDGSVLCNSAPSNSPNAASVNDQITNMAQCGGSGQPDCPANTSAPTTSGGPTPQQQSDADACSSGDNAACARLGITCSAGQVLNDGSCQKTATVAPPCTGAACSKPPTGQVPPPGSPPCSTCSSQGSTFPSTGNSNSGNSNGLNSLLSGLLLGLTNTPQPAPQPAPAQPCSTDPNAYQQQQQQYQQQLQQYQYQLQQYNYQIQLNQYNAQYYPNSAPAATPVPPQQPTACTPSNGSQCQAQPPQPNPASCNVGTWQPQTSGACIVGWLCAPSPGSGTPPTASLSCQPQVADVGMTLAISFACSSGVASSTGFNTNGNQSGSATAVVQTPPAGTNTASYSLVCNNQGQTAGAQCSVQVSAPSIILVANPKTVAAGGISLLGWITTGMQSCVISSPDQSDFTTRNAPNTSPNGTATTSPISSGASATFNLQCLTVSGGTKQAAVTVTASH